MELKPYDIKTLYQKTPKSRKIFSFHYYISNTKEFESCVKRWKNEQSRLNQIIPKIYKEDHYWCKLLQEPKKIQSLLAEGKGGVSGTNVSYKYVRDLRGIHINNLNLNKILHSLHYTIFDYSLFTNCNFLCPPYKKRYGEFIFFENQFKHVKFSNCKFKNMAIFQPILENVLFYQCEFENVDFLPNATGKFQNMLFMQCKINNSNLERIKMSDIIIWGTYEFNNNKLNVPSVTEKKINQLPIIKMSKKWDRESHKDRKYYKSSTSISKPGQPTITKPNYYKRFEKRRSKYYKYDTTRLIYTGMKFLYEHLFFNHTKEYHHEIYLDIHYKYSWLKDEINEKYTSFINKIFSRYILGYGDKPHKPILIWLVSNLIYAFSYIFTGLTFKQKLINRELIFSKHEILPTITDLLHSIYYSFLTSITVSHGDIIPEGIVSKTLCISQGFISIILLTIFTIIITRKYFK